MMIKFIIFFISKAEGAAQRIISKNKPPVFSFFKQILSLSLTSSIFFK